MALTRRQWNNILIFACLAMILLFNVTHKRWLSGDANTRLELIPAEAIILTLDYPAGQLELIGQGWRVSPANLMPEQEAGRLVQQWLGLTALPLSEEEMPSASELLTEPDMVVRITLAGEAVPRVILLRQFKQRWFVRLGEQVGELSDLTIRFIAPMPLRQMRANDA
ncbi:hypothetical protein [Corallincola spongiicola]|uniref:DUF4340 domain-containing protein n=1 Tax=Corallincola spongiicola TaxID=2520508 RepID=A0ABY1WPZ5_9GAMM|nr:hypothetical protein [Corallincola spongiicola]TAA46003.1 hypothetical protein EXY25_11710 [Corallincola spongiicola]